MQEHNCSIEFYTAVEIEHKRLRLTSNNISTNDQYYFAVTLKEIIGLGMLDDYPKDSQHIKELLRLLAVRIRSMMFDHITVFIGTDVNNEPLGPFIITLSRLLSSFSPNICIRFSVNDHGNKILVDHNGFNIIICLGTLRNYNPLELVSITEDTINIIKIGNGAKLGYINNLALLPISEIIINGPVDNCLYNNYVLKLTVSNVSNYKYFMPNLTSLIISYHPTRDSMDILNLNYYKKLTDITIVESSIETISILSRRLSTLTLNSCKNLTGFRYWDVESLSELTIVNSSEEIGTEIGLIIGLKDLIISGAPSVCSDLFLHLCDLTTLCIEDVNMMNVGNSLNNLVNLKSLYLNSCLIKHIIISNLTNLDSLGLSNNFIVDIGKMLEPLVKLKYLDLSHNQIITLGDSFQNASIKLQDIFLNNNFISNCSNLMDNINKFRELVFINLSDNCLIEFKVTASSADIINVPRNQISDLAIIGNPIPKYLNFDNNMISRVSFIDKPNIINLSLSHNNITTIDYTNIGAIQFLDLINNPITEIHYDD